MLTKKDLIKFENRLVTKEYLDKKIAYFMTRDDLNNYDKRLKIYLEARFRPLEEMRLDFHDFKEKVLKSLDWLVGKFQKFEDELTILTGKYPEIHKKLENHETRIVKLETKSS
jgi:hypothetical protein